MLMFYGFIFFLSSLVGFMSFVMNRKHLISTLLSLEFIVLAMFLYMGVLMSFYLLDLYFLVYFLTFSVCEGALDLSILVSMIRSHGNDQFGVFNMVQC